MMGRAGRRAFERQLKRAGKKAGARGISTIQCPACKYFIPVGGADCLCDDTHWEWSGDQKKARWIKNGKPSQWLEDER